MMDGGGIIDVILDRLRDAWNGTIRTVVYLITKRVTKEVTEVLESDYWKILTITKKLITRFTYETSIDEFYESGKKNESIHANDSSLSACLITQLSWRENLIGVASCFDCLYLPENF